MNDNTKVLDQNQSVEPTAMGRQVPVQNNINIGSMRKEQVSPVAVEPNLSEFIKPTGPEVSPSLPQEVSKSGVEVRNNNPDLTFEHKELGVDHAGPHVPVPSSPSGKVIMPMSEEEIVDKLKTGKDDDSGKWLAGLIQKIIKTMGL